LLDCSQTFGRAKLQTFGQVTGVGIENVDLTAWAYSPLNGSMVLMLPPVLLLRGCFCGLRICDPRLGYDSLVEGDSSWSFSSSETSPNSHSVFTSGSFSDSSSGGLSTLGGFCVGAVYIHILPVTGIYQTVVIIPILNDRLDLPNDSGWVPVYCPHIPTYCPLLYMSRW
jgi:hypothetical protein